jgi:hypothetical protein
VTATSFQDFIAQLQDKVHNLLSRIETAVPILAPVIHKVEQFVDHLVARLESIGSQYPGVATSSDSIVATGLSVYTTEVQSLAILRGDDGWAQPGLDPWRSSDINLSQNLRHEWLL